MSARSRWCLRLLQLNLKCCRGRQAAPQQTQEIQSLGFLPDRDVLNRHNLTESAARHNLTHMSLEAPHGFPPFGFFDNYWMDNLNRIDRNRRASYLGRIETSGLCSYLGLPNTDIIEVHRYVRVSGPDQENKPLVLQTIMPLISACVSEGCALLSAVKIPLH